LAHSVHFTRLYPTAVFLLILPVISVLDVYEVVDAIYTDFAAALTNPIAYLSSLEKHSQQLAILEDNYAEVLQPCSFT